VKANLTAGSINRLSCPPGVQQALLSDATVPGLKVRVTASGSKAFVFERKSAGRSTRMTIGSVDTWTIEQARNKARQLAVAMDAGEDPRAAEKTAQRGALTVGQVWALYVADRKAHWGDRHLAEHLRMVQSGGEKPKRGKALKQPDGERVEVLTQPGILHPLTSVPLRDLNDERVEAWATGEAARRPTQARLATRMLKAFLVWCTEQTDLRALVPQGAGVAKTRRTRDALGKPGVAKGSLRREHLKPWFDAVQTMSNQVASAYIQTALLTGARPNEALGIEWADIDWKWASVQVRDKVEGDRVIPLTPYLGDLLWGLPRTGKRVFATAKGKPIAPPRKAFVAACKVAGVPYPTFHGLRRSFKSLTEWLDIPAGVVAQIMGHKPSATAEKHYTERPLDLLRVHHDAIEAWVLDQAGVAFKPREKKMLAIAK
jgi:integrase